MPHSCPKEGGKGGERQRVTLIEGSVFFEQTLLTCVLKRGREKERESFIRKFLSLSLSLLGTTVHNSQERER